MPDEPTPPPPLPAAPPSAHPGPPPQSWVARIWSSGQFLVALGATAAALFYLLRTPVAPPEPPADDRDAASAAVRAVGPGVVRIDPDTPLGKKLQTVTIRPTRVTTPMMSVTGTVVASLRPGTERTSGMTDGLLAAAGGPAVIRARDYWQFNTAELLSAYADWQKAVADVPFNRVQLGLTQRVVTERERAKQVEVGRLEKLFAAGDSPEKDLVTAKADQIQAQLQGRSDIHAAETAVRAAERAESAAAKQLQQFGLDPALLKSVSSDVDIVLADVPEAYLDRVKVGQGCSAQFFGVPNQAFAGQVRSIAPALSKERRSLRVLFTVTDLNDQLRPGMFAEIGLGTDARDVLLAPADGIIHVGRADYVFAGGDAPDTWRVTEVRVGPARGGDAEVYAGVKAGDRVLGRGAILLKPFVVAAFAGLDGSAGGPQPAPPSGAPAGRADK